MEVATAIDHGETPDEKMTLVGEPKLPPAPPSITTIAAPLQLATARSGSPSPLKTPTATDSAEVLSVA